MYFDELSDEQKDKIVNAYIKASISLLRQRVKTEEDQEILNAFEKVVEKVIQLDND